MQPVHTFPSSQVDPNDLGDPEDLRELFDAARQIMKMRIELAELASEKSTGLHHRTQEEEDELAELREKLASAQKQASQVPRLKEENRALGKQVSQLENELDELSNQLHRSQQETDRQLSAKLRDKNTHVAQLLADLQTVVRVIIATNLANTAAKSGWKAAGPNQAAVASASAKSRTAILATPTGWTTATRGTAVVVSVIVDAWSDSAQASIPSKHR
ncbi:hypothetical protein HPB52_024941 [Rhipicephalus sanguineus]|uniref:Uncharacterized protein n=1 Tax=Rhipicephalus sanguineus TaxID=34632 RepID=A0A9D4SMK5_RHISA|nr:hypothetical protein HPB52_024941 [Rhipicephalus sanguineus]